MAYSFSRPSAKRAARVLKLTRTDADEPEARTAPEAPAPGGDLYDPETGLLVPAGQFTAVVCGDPDLAGRLAERLGGHPTDDAADGPRCCWAGSRWTNSRSTPPARWSSYRTRTRCCCPGPCASCSTYRRPER